MPRSRRAGAGVKRDEGREKPKGVLPPRFRGWPGDKTAPENPGPEWINLAAFCFFAVFFFRLV